LCIALAALLLLAAGPAGPPRVETVQGDVSIGSGTPPIWRPARQGDVLRPLDQVRTGSDGRVELRLPAGTVRLYEDTTLRISANAGGTDEGVFLKGGTSIFDIFKRNAAEPFEVHTPEAVVMIKGTRFLVARDPQGAAVAVYSGTVGVRGAVAESSPEVLVRAGFIAVGGADGPFRLDLISPGSDPWEAWSTGDPPPPRPARLAKALDEERLARPRAAARAQADRRISARLSFEGRGDSRPRRVSLDPAGEALGPAARTELRERYIETTLGGSKLFTVEKIQSFDAVQITGTSFTRTLTKSDVQLVLGGSVFPLGAPLLNVLNSEGIAPTDFAVELNQLF
jgi:hypothetical protein